MSTCVLGACCLREMRKCVMTDEESPSSNVQPFRERRQMQIAFEHGEQTHDATISPHVMVWVFAPNGKCRSVSRSWLEFRGRSLDQERGDGWIQGLHPDDRQRCMQIFRPAFISRQAFQINLRVMRANGSYAWIEAHGVPQYLNNGRFLGYSGELREIRGETSTNSSSPPNVQQNLRQILRRIAAHSQSVGLPKAATKKKLSRGAHRISRAGLTLCLNASSTPVVVLDAEGRVIFCNTAAQSLAARHVATTATTVPTSFSHQEGSDLEDAPVVRTWLDSDGTVDLRKVRIQSYPINNGCAAFTFVESSPEDQTPALDRAIVHDLLNVGTGIQLLLDLLLEEPTSRRERAECMGMLSVSLNLLLSEIEKHRPLQEIAQSQAATIGEHDGK